MSNFNLKKKKRINNNEPFKTKVKIKFKNLEGKNAKNWELNR